MITQNPEQSNTQNGITKTSGRSSKQALQREAIHVSHKHIHSFQDLSIPKNCSTIDISKNKLKNFIGLPSLKLLTNLNADNNPIYTFLGASPQPTLFWLSLKNTPLARHTHFRLMCLIVFGSSLKYINSEAVGKTLIQKADSLRTTVLPSLLDGKILLSLSPIKYVIPQDKKSCTATFVTETQNDEKTEISELNEKPPQPSIAAICSRIIKENDISFIEPERLESIRDKLRDMREHFQDFEEEEEEYMQNFVSFDANSGEFRPEEQSD